MNGVLKQLTILVDFDQTLNNLNEAWVAYLNEKHGTTVKTDDIKGWDMTKAFPTLTRAEIFKPLLEKSLWEKVTLFQKHTTISVS